MRAMWQNAADGAGGVGALPEAEKEGGEGEGAGEEKY